MLKSVLLYRRRPLHLHLITDTVRGGKVLSHLLDSWNVTSLRFSTYLAVDAALDVAWISTSHHSSMGGLLKLTVPSILPETLEKVILLDTDLIFLSDIGALWDIFDEFGSEQWLGIAENLSDWYLKTNSSVKARWPAVGRGFNTGVVLMDLVKARLLSWDSLYRRVAKENLKIYNITHLADQDVVNAIITEMPDIVYPLPCTYNFQLNHVYDRSLCSVLVSELKVLHFNSVNKYNEEADFFNPLLNQYQSFAKMSGNFVRHQFMDCSELDVSSYIAQSTFLALNKGKPACTEWQKTASIRYRTHIFFTEFEYQSADVDITLVTQLSFNRLPVLDKLLSKWHGPASVALYLSDAEAYRFIQFLEQSPSLNRRNVACHVVYREGVFFPINQLRNVALENVNTPFVFLADVDFIPASDLYERLVTAVRKQGDMTNKALIVPAFETFDLHLNFPETKKQLLDMLDQDKVFIFKNEVWAAGHLATDYDRWRRSTAPYKVYWSMDFEPYIVVRSSVVPYDTRFLGYGWNKVSHIMELDSIGYEFIVLPDVFVIHFPHLSSSEASRFRASAFYRQCVKLLKGEFMKDLAKRYAHNRSRIVEMMDRWR